MLRKAKGLLSLLGLLSFTPVMATSIGAPSSGFFSQIGAWMQSFVDFLEGPFGLAVTVIGLGVALTVWIMGTRSGEGMGMFVKVIIAGMLLINIPSLIIALKAF